MSTNDVTQTEMFKEAARLAREDSRRYWVKGGYADRAYPQRPLPNWPAGWAGKQAEIAQPPAKIVRAARWLADLKETPHGIIPAMSKRFGISAAECIEAIRLAESYRRGGP